jgi:hypothetical protein
MVACGAERQRVGVGIWLERGGTSMLQSLAVERLIC